MSMESVKTSASLVGIPPRRSPVNPQATAAPVDASISALSVMSETADTFPARAGNWKLREMPTPERSDRKPWSVSVREIATL